MAQGQSSQALFQEVMKLNHTLSVMPWLVGHGYRMFLTLTFCNFSLQLVLNAAFFQAKYFQGTIHLISPFVPFSSQTSISKYTVIFLELVTA